MTLWKKQLEDWVRISCILEVMCPKPGNVCPGHSFTDVHSGRQIAASDFVNSADAIAPIVSRTTPESIGQTILCCVQATRQVVAHNTNLGIILLLVPLAAVPEDQPLVNGIDSVLEGMTVNDSRLVYQAIRIAEPGGLGTAPEEDIHEQPRLPLQACMRLAADRDMIARQYSDGFRQVLSDGMTLLENAICKVSHQQDQITWIALNLLARFGDSLILRKCGPGIAEQVRLMAADVISSGWPDSRTAAEKYQRLDEFLRSDGNRRNPGTTADLIAAILFASQREGRFVPDGAWWQT